MEKYTPSIPLTQAEQEILDAFISNAQKQEDAQVMDLIINCNNKYQFAKTHSVYVKDWEATRNLMLQRIDQGKVGPGITKNLTLAMIEVGDKIIENKLKTVRDFFQKKFGESIYNYIGKDGKTKFLGLF